MAKGTPTTQGEYYILSNLQSGAYTQSDVLNNDDLLLAYAYQVAKCQSVSGNNMGGLGSHASQAIALFSQKTPNLLAAIRESISVFGFPSCDQIYVLQPHGWVPVMQFYFGAYYFNLFPMVSADASNCTVIKGMLDAIAAEFENIEKRHLPGGDLPDMASYNDAKTALGKRQSELQSMYASLDCTNAITQAQQAQQIPTVQSVANAAASTNAGSAQTKTNNLVTYALIGVGLLLVIGAGVIIFHKKKA